MQARGELIGRLKTLGVTTCRRIGPYLILGGVATNLYILAAPQQVLETKTCENARSQLDENASLLAIINAVLVSDTGIYVFNTTGAIRAIVIPVAHWAYNQVAELLDAPQLSRYRLASLGIFENELIKAVSTGMFISMLPLSRAVTIPLLPIAALPLARIYLKHHLFNYQGSASLPTYREQYPDYPKLANSLAAIESVSTGVNLGSSLSALSYFLIDTFYDAAHENDWDYQNYTMYGMAALGMVVGMSSIFNKHAHRICNNVSETIEMFYLIAMPLISMTLCFSPQLEDVNTFMDEGIYVVLSIAAAALGMAEISRRLMAAAEDDFESENSARIEEVDSEEDFVSPFSNESEASSYGTFFYKSGGTLNSKVEDPVSILRPGDV